MTVRFESTATGEVAILPRAEYDALIARAAEADEDTVTARLVDAGISQIASGEPVFPKEVADRLVAGENPVRVFREWRGFTQTYLADFKLGIGQSHLSDIETGRRKG